MEDIWVFTDVNIKGRINLLDAYRHHEVRKIVFSSSGGVFMASWTKRNAVLRTEDPAA
jgi:nucleoside-diphosphate-sugar epimerase